MDPERSRLDPRDDDLGPRVASFRREAEALMIWSPSTGGRVVDLDLPEDVREVGFAPRGRGPPVERRVSARAEAHALGAFLVREARRRRRRESVKDHVTGAARRARLAAP